MTALKRETATYQARLSELMEHVGRFVVIKGDRVEGVLETYGDALRLAYERYPDGGFLVKKISPAPQVANFTRELTPKCQV